MRSIDPKFQEVLCAALLVFLPAHRDHSLSAAQARARLLKAIDLPRGAMIGWPAACVDLVVRSQLTLNGEPGGIDKASIEAATDAPWPRVQTAARYGAAPHFAWQDRADIGDVA
jgi:hypothetical protein